MQNSIAKIFDSLGFSKEEYFEILKANEGLELSDPITVVQNLKLVIDYGYPEEDVADLVRVNPAFLLNTPAFLEQKLISFGEEVEDIIKENPFVI